ncbi:MAG: DUF6076 domain-containing protein [Lachnospiraceae bacterium]|nr:DUF6076 domain-containing protein [Lachnospiraceae bacterium]
MRVSYMGKELITMNDELNLELPIEYGMVVQYEGENNNLFYKEGVIYPIGGMMCELARVKPMKIKDNIVRCPYFKHDTNFENLGEAFVWLEEDFINSYGPVAGKILTSEFMELTKDMWENFDNEEYMESLKTDNSSSKINEYIFAETGFSDLGKENVGHVLLSVYTQQAMSFVVFKHLFVDMMESCLGHEAGDDVEVKVLSLFGNMVGVQHIDFRIMCLEGGFASVYTIKTCLSLLAFEFAHCFEKNVQFNKCKNCGEYFVLTGRVDAVYCSYPAPDAEGKTCKDIGAQVTRANKEKNDITTSEYRKTYMRLKMKSNRNKKDNQVRMQLESLVRDGKEWRKRLSQGAVTSEEFLEWLKMYQ